MPAARIAATPRVRQGATGRAGPRRAVQDVGELTRNGRQSPPRQGLRMAHYLCRTAGPRNMPYPNVRCDRAADAGLSVFPAAVARPCHPAVGKPAVGTSEVTTVVRQDAVAAGPVAPHVPFVAIALSLSEHPNSQPASDT